MDGLKLSLILVFMVSAVAARLIPTADVDKEHNSADQERLDRQDYSEPIPLPETPKPAILATGICARSPNLPCCKKTISTYEILNRPLVPADIEYPDCRSDGYYAAKQCRWFGCYCVDPNGNSAEGETQPGDFVDFNIICPEIPKPAILATGICAQSPTLPCCERTIEFYKILSQPVAPADIEYPDCRSDGYYAAKQCDWIGCYCVDPNGKRVEGTTQPGDFENRNIICPEIPKPAILATGICARSPNLPCCKEMIKVYELLKGPALIADLSYPHCRYYGYYAGYYAAKQCTWAGCHCVDLNGKSVEETVHFNKYYMICPEFAVEKPKDLDLGSHEYEVDPADKLLTSEEISNLPNLADEEDPKTAGKTIESVGNTVS